MPKVSQTAPIAGKILFIFSLKMKRLYRKAGISFPENADVSLHKKFEKLNVS